MGWIMIAAMMICVAFAPLKLVFKADLDASRWQIYLEPGYHDIDLPGGSERGLALRPQKQNPPVKKKKDVRAIAERTLAWTPGILKAIQYLWPRLKIQGEAAILFGTGDAAQSAMLYGALNGVKQILQAKFPGKWRIRLGVDFARRMVSGRMMGMIEFRVGHIMYAALLAALEYAKGRIHSWTNTPSKAL